MLTKLVQAGFMRGLGALANFAFAVAIGRTLGAEGAGRFFLGLTVMTLVGKVARMGLGVHLLRYGSILWDLGYRADLRRLYADSLRNILSLAGAAVLLLWLVRGWLAGSVLNSPGFATELGWFLAAAVPFCVLGMNAGLFKGMGYASLANLTEAGVLPTLSLVLLVILRPVTVTGAVVLYLAVAVFAATSSSVWTLMRLGRGEGGSPTAEPRPWFRFGLQTMLAGVGGYLLLWLPFMVLARSAPDAVIGGFSAAQRTVMMITLVNVVVNSVFLKQFAPAFEARDVAALRRARRNTTFLMILGTGPPALVCLLMPEIIMSLYGGEFVAGAESLRILAVGFFAAMACGPADEVLLLFGSAQVMTRISYAVLAVEVVLAFSLIPSLGAPAAAWVTGAAFCGQRLMSRVMMDRAIAGLERSGPRGD